MGNFVFTSDGSKWIANSICTGHKQALAMYVIYSNDSAVTSLQDLTTDMSPEYFEHLPTNVGCIRVSTGVAQYVHNKDTAVFSVMFDGRVGESLKEDVDITYGISKVIGVALVLPEEGRGYDNILAVGCMDNPVTIIDNTSLSLAIPIRVSPYSNINM